MSLKCLTLLATVLLFSPAVCLMEWDDTLASLETTGIPDNTTVGTVLGSLRAHGATGSISYASNSTYFYVDSYSGTVTLQQALSYNNVPLIAVRFTATDGSNSSNVIGRNRAIHILSIGNHAPHFDLAAYSASIIETAAVGSTVYSSIRVTDEDIGLQGQVSVSCAQPAGNLDAQLACTKFNVVIAPVGALAPNSYFVRITLASSLDYARNTNYSMLIYASDAGYPPLSGSATVTINVRNKADVTPVFLNAPITFFVQDHQPSTQVLTTIQATTGENRTLQMSITSDPLNYFTIDTTTFSSLGFFVANLRSNGNVDYGAVQSQYGERYPLNIAATVYDGNTNTGILGVTTVTAIVLSPSNHPPAFQFAQYSAQVLETITYGSLVPTLNMLVTDPDSGTAGSFILSATCNPSPNDIFGVIPASGLGTVSASLVVWKPDYLNFRNPSQRTYTVTVKASNNATLFGTTIVTINVLPANEPPYFNQLSYSTAIRDDRAVDSQIIRVSASDTDAGLYGSLVYSINPGDNTNYVSIDPMSGLIILMQPLNYSQVQVLQYVVKVTDGAGGTDTAYLTVSIQDSRSLGPRFAKDAYDAYVFELVSDLQPGIKVFATALQQDRVVSYRLIPSTDGRNYSDLFSLDHLNGTLTMLHGVDINDTPGRGGLYHLIVEASDDGVVPVFSTVPITINVIDTNNHYPVFPNPTYTASLSESTPPGTTIMKVNATDSDINQNAQISFLLGSGGRDNFKISPDGEIYVSPTSNLVSDVQPTYYNVTVYAFDHGSPPKTSSVIVSIKVVGSDRPKFVSSSYTFFVSDSVSVNFMIGSVLALVAPEHVATANIVYEIVPDTITATNSNGTAVTAPAGGYDYKQSFGINATTGTILVNRRLSFQYAAYYNLLVRANNTNSQFQLDKSDRTNVTIYVGPSSNPNPIGFLPPSPDNMVNKSVPEEIPVGRIVHTVQVYDAQNPNAVFVYTLMPGSDTVGYLLLNTTNGAITVAKRIDYEAMSPPYQIKMIVNATEVVPPTNRSVTGTITFTVYNINDMQPTFTQPYYKFITYDNATAGQVIGTVSATDADSPPYNIFTYNIMSGNLADNFNINPTTGVVTTKKPLTTPDIYNLIVVAIENYTRLGAPSSVHVTIIVVDLSTGNTGISFSGSPYFFYTFEDAVINSTVGQIIATDYLQSTNVTYGIVPGNYSNLFQINPVTGEVIVNMSLNGYGRETPYVLNISATAGSPSRTTYTLVSITLFNSTTPGGHVYILFPGDGAKFPVVQYTKTGQIVEVRGAVVNQNVNSLRFSFLQSSNGALIGNKTTFSTDPQTGRPLRGNITFTISTRPDSPLIGDITYDDNGFPNNDKPYTFPLNIVAIADSFPPIRSTSHFISVTVVADYPSFFSCGTTVPVDFEVNETAINPSVVTALHACNPAAAANVSSSQIYYYIVGGNYRPGDGAVPFKITDPTTSIILTNASFINQIQSYNLTVIARKDPCDPLQDCGNIPGSSITISIAVKDEDNNGPSYTVGGIGKFVQRGIRDFPTLGESIVQMYAGDADILPQNRNKKYSISSILFESSSYPGISGIGAFTINSDTGDIYPAFASYRNYSFGDFKITVRAMDNQGRYDTSILTIFVVQESDLIGKTYNDRPAFVRPLTSTFLQAVKQGVGRTTKTDNVYVSESDLHYHIDDRNVSSFTYRKFVDRPYLDRDYSDLCFYVIKDGSVIDYESNKDMYNGLNFSSVAETQCRSTTSNMTDGCPLSRCYPHLTTHPWSGYMWTWWWLIALALLIFLIALILAIAVCCIAAWHEGGFNEHQNYVYLDAPNEFEWQEASQRMN